MLEVKASTCEFRETQFNPQQHCSKSGLLAWPNVQKMKKGTLFINHLHSGSELKGFIILFDLIEQTMFKVPERGNNLLQVTKAINFVEIQTLSHLTSVLQCF